MEINIDKIVCDNMFAYRFKKSQEYRNKHPLDIDFLRAIAKLDKSHSAIEREYGYCRTTVSYWRKKLIPIEIYNEHFITRNDYTEKDMLVIRNVDLPDKEVAKILGRTRQAIHLARKKYLSDEQKYEIKFRVGKWNKIEISQDIFENNMKRATISEIKMIKDKKYNNKELAIMLGRTPNAIITMRLRYKNVDI